jgi:hypothetical protein
MGCMAYGYGMYGIRIWDVWHTDMGCMVCGYGTIEKYMVRGISSGMKVSVVMNMAYRYGYWAWYAWHTDMG